MKEPAEPGRHIECLLQLRICSGVRNGFSLGTGAARETSEGITPRTKEKAVLSVLGAHRGALLRFPARYSALMARASRMQAARFASVTEMLSPPTRSWMK